MAVQSDGADLSITDDIVAEFGGSVPHSISEYYGGGDLVPAGANGDVPTSGQIAFSDMYGSVAATVFSISSNANNLNIKTLAAAAGGNQATPVIMTINSGVTIGAANNSAPALKTDTGWSNGVTIEIINNGSIVGGAGGAAAASSKRTRTEAAIGGGLGGVGGYTVGRNIAGTTGGYIGAAAGAAGGAALGRKVGQDRDYDNYQSKKYKKKRKHRHH